MVTTLDCFVKKNLKSVNKQHIKSCCSVAYVFLGFFSRRRGIFFIRDLLKRDVDFCVYVLLNAHQCVSSLLVLVLFILLLNYPVPPVLSLLYLLLNSCEFLICAFLKLIQTYSTGKQICEKYRYDSCNLQPLGTGQLWMLFEECRQFQNGGSNTRIMRGFRKETSIRLQIIIGKAFLQLTNQPSNLSWNVFDEEEG